MYMLNLKFFQWFYYLLNEIHNDVSYQSEPPPSPSMQSRLSVHDFTLQNWDGRGVHTTLVKFSPVPAEYLSSTLASQCLDG